LFINLPKESLERVLLGGYINHNFQETDKNDQYTHSQYMPNAFQAVEPVHRFFCSIPTTALGQTTLFYSKFTYFTCCFVTA
jgi:hypothetical protein